MNADSKRKTEHLSGGGQATSWTVYVQAADLHQASEKAIELIRQFREQERS